MGKVASSTIENSLSKQFKITHTHSLFKNYITGEQFNLNNPIKKRDHKFIMGKMISIYLKKIKRDVKIITLVRDPIARNISMFFQDLHLLLNDEFTGNARTEYQTGNFFEYFFHKKINHFYFNEWFDKELLKALDINIYNYSFDKEAGYKIIKKDNISILIIKVEKLNQLENEIKKFTGYSDFELVRTNSANRKWYSEIYKNFKNNVKFDENLINKIYTTKFVKHFYSENEIKKFKNRWQIND